MKTIILAILLLLCIAGVGQGFEWKDRCDSIQKIIPQYLLVIRYWGIVSQRGTDGSSVYLTQEWVYLNETYNSLDEVISRLQNYTGAGMSKEEAKYALVGLWELGDRNNIAEKVLNIKETVHSKEIIIEQQEWTEIEWSKK